MTGIPNQIPGSSQCVSVKDLAEEAEFQLASARDLLGWLGALASAIQLDNEHRAGRHTRALAALAQYLDDTGMTSVDGAIEQFKAIAAAPTAPQNEQVPLRGAQLEGGQ